MRPHREAESQEEERSDVEEPKSEKADSGDAVEHSASDTSQQVIRLQHGRALIRQEGDRLVIAFLGAGTFDGNELKQMIVGNPSTREMTRLYSDLTMIAQYRELYDVADHSTPAGRQIAENYRSRVEAFERKHGDILKQEWKP